MGNQFYFGSKPVMLLEHNELAKITVILFFIGSANAISEGLSRDNALVHRANWQSGTRNMVRMLRSAPAYEFDSGNNHGVVSPPRVSASAPAGAKDDTASYYDWRKAEIMLRPRAYEPLRGRHNAYRRYRVQKPSWLDRQSNFKRDGLFLRTSKRSGNTKQAFDGPEEGPMGRNEAQELGGDEEFNRQNRAGLFLRTSRSGFFLRTSRGDPQDLEIIPAVDTDSSSGDDQKDI